MNNKIKTSDLDAKREKKDYQRKRLSYYLGSDPLYRENLYFIRQYPELIMLLKEKGDTISKPDRLGIRAKGRISRPTENEAVRNIMLEELKDLALDEIKKRIDIIERALFIVPVEYRKGVFNHIVYREPYKTRTYFLSHINTWKFWTQKYVYEVATRRGQKPIIEALRRKDEF